MEILHTTQKPDINRDRLYAILSDAEAHREPIEPILNRAKKLEGLTLSETAQLLTIHDDAELALLLETAGYVKQKIYGRRIVLFAPLYIGNICSNDCLYCAFRAPNTQLVRKRLTLSEIEAETRALLREGHKRIL
ncbi:MAG TPA: [FeFe] hydrogenase H-cluster radical SAM maturase HydG, partial [Spirochaetales bacterium]|nr:[FeFe] hydrogenase H-cluster radical SAM maturase HydG [Spirochaetales bacterium]